jgi:peptidoglycan hydrolase CwlO-like protein
MSNLKLQSQLRAMRAQMRDLKKKHDDLKIENVRLQAHMKESNQDAQMDILIRLDRTFR